MTIRASWPSFWGGISKILHVHAETSKWAEQEFFQIDCHHHRQPLPPDECIQSVLGKCISDDTLQRYSTQTSQEIDASSVKEQDSWPSQICSTRSSNSEGDLGMPNITYLYAMQELIMKDTTLLLPKILSLEESLAALWVGQPCSFL